MIHISPESTVTEMQPLCFHAVATRNQEIA